MIVLKINDAVETNLHVIPKITNEIPTQPIDVTQLRHVKALHLADQSFNVLGSIHILLSADVLEEAMLDNQFKDNGVVTRDSIFGCLVSGSVQKQKFQTEIQFWPKLHQLYPQAKLRI